jgi:hypothetical protein
LFFSSKNSNFVDGNQQSKACNTLPIATTKRHEKKHLPHYNSLTDSHLAINAIVSGCPETSSQGFHLPHGEA